MNEELKSTLMARACSQELADDICSKLAELAALKAQHPAAPADRAAAVERAAALAEKVSGIETANTIRHGGVIMSTDNPCPHCTRY